MDLKHKRLSTFAQLYSTLISTFYSNYFLEQNYTKCSLEHALMWHQAYVAFSMSSTIVGYS